VTCGEPIAFGALVDYWAEAPEGDASAALEEHLFSCDPCADRMASVATMARGVARLGRGGARLMMTPALLERLRADAVRIRTYTVDAGGSVACTIAPGDEVCLTTLRADLRNVRRLDLDLLDEDGGLLSHAADVPFDRARGEVLLADTGAFVRSLPAMSFSLRLTEVEPSGRRVVGEYRMNHRPWPG